MNERVYPVEVKVIVRGGGNLRKTIKTAAAWEKFMAKLDEKYGLAACDVRTSS